MLFKESKLRQAAQEGRLATLSNLLDNNAKVNDRDGRGWTGTILRVFVSHSVFYLALF